MSGQIGTNFNYLKKMIFLEEVKNCVHPLKIILPNKKIKLCKTNQKWLTSSFSLTNIFFRRVSKVSLLKETSTMRENDSRLTNHSSSNVNTNSNTSLKQNNPCFSKYTSRDSSQKPSSTESSSQEKMSSVFCAYCKRRGLVISDCLVLKARKVSKPVVAYTFNRILCLLGFHIVLKWGINYMSPPCKDFTCSLLTSRDYVTLSRDLTHVYQDSISLRQDFTTVYKVSTPVHQDLTPVHQDPMPVLQDLTPVYQDSTPVYQDIKSVYQESAPVYQDLMPVCQDFVPASQDLPIFKDDCATLDSVSEVYKLFLFRRCVSVMNLSVRGFVTLDLLGVRRSATPPVCWKRWRNQIIVFL